MMGTHSCGLGAERRQAFRVGFLVHEVPFSLRAFLIQRSNVWVIESKNGNMLYMIGLGLADETDVTVKGLELIKKAERVYLEAYTSVLLVDTAKLVRLLFTQTIQSLDLTLMLFTVGSILWTSSHYCRS